MARVGAISLTGWVPRDPLRRGLETKVIWLRVSVGGVPASETYCLALYVSLFFFILSVWYHPETAC